jgi:hypothetical protein
MAISEQQLEAVVKTALFPWGQNRFIWNRGTASDLRLKEGIELLNKRGDWAVSLFRNVNNIENDVEIAIAPARIAPDGMAGAVLAWLESVRGEFEHREHKPHRGSYQGDVFRIGLKLAEVEVFLRYLMAEVLKRPSQSPWMGKTEEAAVVSGELVVSEPSPSLEDLRGRSIAYMVAMAFSARDQSGLEKTSVVKDKQVRFESAEELRVHLDLLWKSELCALSGLQLDLSGSDPDLAPSLDRINSNRHYEVGNLQIVARFINRWKSDDDQSNFVRLLGLLKNEGGTPP